MQCVAVANRWISPCFTLSRQVLHQISVPGRMEGLFWCGSVRIKSLDSGCTRQPPFPTATPCALLIPSSESDAYPWTFPTTLCSTAEATTTWQRDVRIIVAEARATSHIPKPASLHQRYISKTDARLQRYWTVINYIEYHDLLDGGDLTLLKRRCRTHAELQVIFQLWRRLLYGNINNFLKEYWLKAATAHDFARPRLPERIEE